MKRLWGIGDDDEIPEEAEKLPFTTQFLIPQRTFRQP